jgi:transcriptional regulator with XRE-family HTH domain
MTWLSPSEGPPLKSLRTPAHRELLRRLVAARSRKGVTQHELAKKLRRHQSFVAKYERGERRLEVIEFVQICRELGVSAESILKNLR